MGLETQAKGKGWLKNSVRPKHDEYHQKGQSRDQPWASQDQEARWEELSFFQIVLICKIAIDTGDREEGAKDTEKSAYDGGFD